MHNYCEIYQILTQFPDHISFQMVWLLQQALEVKHQQIGSEIMDQLLRPLLFFLTLKAKLSIVAIIVPLLG